jgi:hypothetical protein
MNNKTTITLDLTVEELLKVLTDVLTCRRDKEDVAFTQMIGYSDFPLDKITIWVMDGIILLPSEY